MSAYAGVHPKIHHSKVQTFLFLLITCGSSSIVLLSFLLLVYKEEAIIVTDITDMFSGCSMLLHGLLRLVTLYTKRYEIFDLLQRMDKYFWDPEVIQEPETMLIYKKSIKKARFAFRYFAGICMLTVSMYCLQTFILEGQHLAFECYQPEWLSFYQLWFYQTVFGYGFVNAIFVMDTLLMLFISSTKIQFQLLNQSIKKMFDGNVSVQQEQMQKIVAHHNFLLDYVKQINNTFSTSLLAFMFILVSSMCVEMYNVSSKGSMEVFLKATFYISAALFQFVVCYCIPGEDLAEEANRITDNVYFSNWLENTKSPTAITLIMITGQKNLIISAGGFMKIDLATSLATIKTMLSYCMFLRTVGSN